MTRRRGPTKRLLVLPALLVAGVLVVVHAVEAVAPAPVVPNPGVSVRAELPPLAGDETRTCARGRDGAEVDDVRSQLDLRGRVTSTMVLGCPAAFDGLEVRYVGEVVGDVLERRGGAWVLVNDDEYALDVGPLPAHGAHRGTNAGLTVWLPAEAVEQISGLGRPNQRGDVIEVRGRLLRTDPADGGGLTIRAEEVEVVAAAVRVAEPLHVAQLWLAVVAVVVAAGVWGLRRRAAAR